MNIVWVASEAVPFAKTGGLADVSSALPDALAERGHEVAVIMPYYPQLTGKLNLRFSRSIDLLGVPLGGTTQWAKIHELPLKPGLNFYFIEYNRYFDRPTLYDWCGQEYSDNAERFIFFSRAAMEAVCTLDLKPDILHANDWHSALCCVYLKSPLYSGRENFRNCRSVMTIHNIGYQGIFDKGNLYWSGLGWEYFNYTCLEFYDRINLLKGGIMTADMVNTVSPTYASEILSPEFGFSLDSCLRHCASQGKLRGILNGIDDKTWNPAADRFLPAFFSSSDPSPKREAKRALQQYFHLPEREETPLFATISRLAYQKGLDVFASGLEDLLYHDDFQFVVIGSGERFLEDHFRYLAGKYPERLAVYLGYAPDSLSHLAEGGADFFVMPSRYEPCGLNQMYSMRYGTLPIVRHTGGLADTVTNYDCRNAGSATGFVFWDLFPEALNGTIRWAAELRKNDPETFARMRFNAMTRDFSWNNTASHYERMYDDAHR